MTTITAPSTPLTARELEVARLMITGLRNKQIAERLFISRRTVESHLRSARAKTGTHNRTQLMLWLTDATA
jgi:DNA-binding CsgD family transcriptional regulator